MPSLKLAWRVARRVCRELGIWQESVLYSEMQEAWQWTDDGEATNPPSPTPALFNVCFSAVRESRHSQALPVCPFWVAVCLLQTKLFLSKEIECLVCQRRSGPEKSFTVPFAENPHPEEPEMLSPTVDGGWSRGGRSDTQWGGMLQLPWGLESRSNAGKMDWLLKTVKKVRGLTDYLCCS